MTAKLIKDHADYHLVDDKRFIIGTTDKVMLSCTDKQKLSLTNCQAIERGYDLDKWIAKKVNDFNIVDKAVEFSNANSKNNGAYLAYIVGAYEMAKQLELRQTQWDVEIAMRFHGTRHKKGEWIPKFDADGCLILKLKSE